MELVGLLQETYPFLQPHRELAGKLDQYYIPTRYPNGLPAGVPYEAYGQSQAQEAVTGVGQILQEVRQHLEAQGSTGP